MVPSYCTLLSKFESLLYSRCSFASYILSWKTNFDGLYMSFEENFVYCLEPHPRYSLGTRSMYCLGGVGAGGVFEIGGGSTVKETVFGF